MHNSRSDQYEPPRLEIIGTVSDLTLGSKGSLTDLTAKLPGSGISP